MDVVSDILGALHLRGSLYFTTEFTPPWGVRVPRLGKVARFHLVMRGSCWVGVEGESGRVQLETGDLVLVPHGAEHVLADEPDSPVTGLDEVLERSGFAGRGALVFGGDDRGQPTRLLCGHYEFDPHAAHPFLRRLPPRIVFRHEQIARLAALDDVFRLIVREAREARPGNNAVVQRLSEVLFIQLVRAWTDQADPSPGVMSALGDPGLSSCLAAMHGDPGRRWTLTLLAREAGLSRSVFAERFQRLVGIPPKQYLAAWRVQYARSLLEDHSQTIEAIAARVGYDSVAAFSRVFLRWVGESPGRYRRRVQSSSTTRAAARPSSVRTT